MKCDNCGKNISTQADQCPACGAIFRNRTIYSDLFYKIPSGWIGVLIGLLLSISLINVGISMINSIGIGAGSALVLWIVIEWYK